MMKKPCGHDEENHGPPGQLAPGRKFNFNIFGDCDEENENDAPREDAEGEEGTT
jgi:hypothetical protein